MQVTFVLKSIRRDVHHGMLASLTKSRPTLTLVQKLGNGTQKAFFNDPNVLYISIHRHDGGSFYPQSDFGALEVTGEGAGEGTYVCGNGIDGVLIRLTVELCELCRFRSVNIPWPKRGFGDADYLYAFQKIIMPIAYEFAPELVISEFFPPHCLDVSYLLILTALLFSICRIRCRRW